VLAGPVQLLHFCGDAAQGIAFQCYAALQLDGVLCGVLDGVLPDAGDHEASGRIPFVAVGLGRRMGRGGQLTFDQSAAFVPAVVAAALPCSVAVRGFHELACRIPAVALQPLVKPFFLHEPVQRVPGKAALGSVFVDERVRRPALSYSKARVRPPCVRWTSLPQRS
jgi:hypothetical protein